MKERAAGSIQHGYIGGHRRGKDGKRDAPKAIEERRRKRKYAIAAGITLVLALPALLKGIDLKNNKNGTNTSSVSTTGSYLPQDSSYPTPSTPEAPPDPPEITKTITANLGDSQWKLSEKSFLNATGNKPQTSETNATTVINAATNIANGKAPYPEIINPGQNLDILNDRAVKLIDKSLTNPTTASERNLGDKLRELNSGSTSIKQTATEKADLIAEIQIDLANGLAETPIFNSMVRSFGNDPTLASTDKQSDQLQSPTASAEAMATTVDQTRSKPTVVFDAATPPVLSREARKTINGLSKERKNRKKQA